MTFDEELTLIGLTYTQDDLGQSVETETRTTVLCEVLSVTRSEFFAAAQANMQPEYTFVVNRYDYEGQQRVEYEGKSYDVIRHFAPKKSKDLSDFETVELVCQGATNRA
jgi:SPP1 family predicted phage head-tail adaptor